MADVKGSSPAVQLVMFDLAGTTVDDTVNGLPLVTLAMKDAFKAQGMDIQPETVNDFRGLEKKEAIKQILQKHFQGRGSQGEDKGNLTESIFKHFKESLNKHLACINKEIPGTTKVFRDLKSKGVKISVGSGFPHSVVESIVATLGWGDLVDYVSSAEKEGNGRPHPAMIHAAMRLCGVSDARSVVKVGDTKVDVEEGKRAGCWTVSVLTGTQTANTLKAASPDFIINSVENLLPVILEIESKAK